MGLNQFLPSLSEITNIHKAEVVVILALVIFVLYVFYSLNLFTKD